MDACLSVILLYGFTVVFITADNTKPCTVHKENSGRPLPKLDNQFTAVIEAKIVQKNYSINIVEYYDYINNRGAVHLTKNGSTEIWLYDFKRYESFMIRGDKCTTNDMDSDTFNFFLFTKGLKGHGGHIVSVVDIFDFGTKYNETFVSGESRARGIPVNHWTSCIQWQKPYDADFQLDYYFAREDYLSPAGRRQVPVQAVLKGIGKNKDQIRDSTISGNHTFHHIYDFVSYIPGPIRDPTVFEVPKGYVCHHLKPKKKKVPTATLR